MSLLDNPKSSEKTYTAANKNVTLLQCDVCDFESVNKEQMITHISDEQEDCYCCYLCPKYFETKQSLKYPNEFIHDENYTVTESDGEDTPIKPNEVTQQQKKPKKKKKGGNK